MCDFLSVKEPMVEQVTGESVKHETRILHTLEGTLYPVVVFVNARGQDAGVCTEESGILPVGRTEDELLASALEQLRAAISRPHIHEAEGEATFCGVNRAA